MQFIDTADFNITEPTVVTIGKFDGRHRGHQKLLKEMLQLKSLKGYRLAVFTFSTVPGTLVHGTSQTVITTNRERRSNMEKIGVDYLIEYPFTPEVSHMSPEAFVKEILVGKMNAKAIVVGTDCGFGYKRAGNAALLASLAADCGYELVVIVKEKEDHRDISSTYIREELARGNMEKVNELLGQPYAVHGTVVHGNHIGGTLLGFPTANILPPPEKLLPPFGVYVSRVEVDGRTYRGITNIGKKPTVQGENPVGVETFIYDLDENLYGKNIEVQLLHFERPEQKFGSLEELKAQIEKDKAYGAEYYSRKNVE